MMTMMMTMIVPIYMATMPVVKTHPVCSLAVSAVKSESCGEQLVVAGASVAGVRLTFADNSTCLGDVTNADDVTCSVQSRLTFKLSRCVHHDVIGIPTAGLISIIRVIIGHIIITDGQA